MEANGGQSDYRFAYNADGRDPDLQDDWRSGAPLPAEREPDRGGGVRHILSCIPVRRERRSHRDAVPDAEHGGRGVPGLLL